MFFSWLRKRKTGVIDTVNVDVPKPERSKTWKCSCGRENNDNISTCTCGTNKREIVFAAAQQLDEAYIANNVEEKYDQETITDIYFLFSFIQDLDPSGLPFVENHVGIDVATGRPYRQSFFCTSPSFPPPPIASAPVPISFEELQKLALCELENCDNHREWNKKRAKKLERIVSTKENEWKTLLNL